MMQAELVSVVVPCYNKAEFVAETIDSVLAQRGVSIELIIVDDCSRDGSWEVIERYRNRALLHRLDPNRGSTHSRNYGAALARGEYLMFLDADDVLAAPDTILGMVEVLRAHPSGVAASPWKKLFRDGNRWAPVPSGKPPRPPTGDFLEGWLTGWYVPPCAVLWSREAYQGSGGWREMGPWDDAEIMMRTLVQGTRIVFSERGEAHYRILPSGSSLRSLPTPEAVESRIGVLDTIAAHAEERNLLPRYRQVLGRAYYELANTHASHHPELSLRCFRRADAYLGRSPLSGSVMHRMLWRALGLERKERVTRWLTSHRLLQREPTGASGAN